MSSATHYWPLSNVDNGNIAGTIDGRAFGNIKVITGVKDKPDSALQFSESGMYIDVPFYAQDCLTFPDTCPSKHLTLSFMASFDATAANWQNVAILDSLGGNKQNSTGLSVTINQQKLVFVVSYVDRLWTVSIPIEGDGVWRHYVMTCSPIAIEVLVNGKSAISRLVTIISYINNTTSKVRDYIVSVFISILHFIKKNTKGKGFILY